jgi:hypothetical protein
VDASSVHLETPLNPSVSCTRVVLLHFCFVAGRNDFGVARCATAFCSSRAATIPDRRRVGQAGSLRPIANRPNAAYFQHSSFAACRYAEQVV